jgi:iron(II)-dependent oxidoreductase
MENIILVIDDNPELVDGVKLTLEMEGYQVLAATNGEEALGMLERITPDLILADIMMPEMDGYELYKHVHQDERWVRVPFIFLTARTSREDVRLGKEMGADDYITKPFDPEDVVAAVRGRLKRMAEVTGKPAPADAIGNLRRLWQSRLGPLRVPLVALAALFVVFILFAILVAALRQPTDDEAETSSLASPLRPDSGEMVLVPAGEFILGSAQEPGALSERRVDLAAFWIDKYEVTNAQYQRFVQETGHQAPWGDYPAGQADYPVTGVSWQDANAYCQWAEKRLPTEAEWEKAARGDDGRRYPWGDGWRDGLANTDEVGAGGPRPVGSYPGGASPYGVQDMAGNVWEWVNDWFGASQETKVIRGGAWNAISRWAQAVARNSTSPTRTQDNLGFRCAQ